MTDVRFGDQGSTVYCSPMFAFLTQLLSPKRPVLSCSFCGTAVDMSSPRYIVAGPYSYICSECVHHLSSEAPTGAGKCSFCGASSTTAGALHQAADPGRCDGTICAACLGQSRAMLNGREPRATTSPQ